MPRVPQIPQAGFPDDRSAEVRPHTILTVVSGVTSVNQELEALGEGGSLTIHDLKGLSKQLRSQGKLKV